MSTRRRDSGLAVLAIGVLVTGSAGAEPPKLANPLPAPTAPAAPDARDGNDVVRLKNGGFLRGKISELWPGKSVSIVSASGKAHEFAMSEVSYAGPETEDPTAPPSATPPT